jgi:hypothetical protein
VQVPRCSWQSKALDEAPYKLSGAVAKLASITFLSLAFSWIRLNLGFLLRENLLLYSSNLPLGVPNWTVIYTITHRHSSALCFTRRVRRTRVSKGFKLPHDQQMYDGSQEPTLWLSDYLQAVQILGGTRATAMQSLQLHLTGAARSWLNTLPNDSIGSWGELES